MRGFSEGSAPNHHKVGLMDKTADVFVLIKEGKEPVYVTRPTHFKGEDLNDFLVAEGILHKKADSDEIKEPIGSFLNAARITVDAFYFTDKEPFLLMFDMKTKTKDKSGNEIGAIEGLTGDSDLEQLFGGDLRFRASPVQHEEVFLNSPALRRRTIRQENQFLNPRHAGGRGSRLPLLPDIRQDK